MKGIMDADTNICAVILNYNDAQTTKKLAESWKDSRAIHNIIIVDNCSTDDSWEQLQVLKDEKVDLIRTEKNGGYGYGNNTGIRYAIEHNGATHVLVANPAEGYGIFLENMLTTAG